MLSWPGDSSSLLGSYSRAVSLDLDFVGTYAIFTTQTSVDGNLSLISSPELRERGSGWGFYISRMPDQGWRLGLD